MVLSKNSRIKVYHTDYCPYFKLINKKNCSYVTSKKAEQMGYKQCSWCGGLHGIYLRAKLDNCMFGEKVRRYVRIGYDRKNKGLLFRTTIGIWRLIEDPEQKRQYLLYHHSFIEGEKQLSDLDLSKRKFHRQGDVEPTDNITGIVTYIYQHDKAKSIADGDYRKLPRKTKKQKKYYKQAKKKDFFNYMRKMDELFKQIEDERRTTNG